MSKRNRFLAPILAFALMLPFFTSFFMPSAQAIENEPEQIFYQENLDDGYIAETFITVYPPIARNNYKDVRIVKTYKDMNDKQVASVTLNVKFIYNGITAGVTNVSYSKSLAPGWSYTNHKITRTTLSTSDGGTVTLTANLRTFLNNVPVRIYVHCAPSGALSY